VNAVEARDPGAEQLAAELGAAIEQRRLELYFQPIVSLVDRVASEVEALLRWPRNEDEILAPADFIEVARHYELLPALERLAIDTAFEQLSRWRRSTDLDISLNLTDAYLYSDRLPGEIRESAERHGVASRRLSLEVSEPALVTADADQVRRLRAVFADGVGLIVDHYRGEVSASRLAELPVNALKISRQVVGGIPDSAAHTETAKTALRLADELGLRVIANGVESPGQLAVLRDMGCEYGQGFLFSVPMPADVLAERAMPR
jgi:EAL domain-containing protein (putative c-di-GMP-specific phosphodiesterase class I)